MNQKSVNLKEGYVVSRELEEALLVAEVTKRPLLIKGEPGTGKTLLAEHISKTRKLPIFKWHVKSTSLAKDGLYFYDEVMGTLKSKKIRILWLPDNFHLFQGYSFQYPGK